MPPPRCRRRAPRRGRSRRMILPSDTCWDEGGVVAAAAARAGRAAGRPAGRAQRRAHPAREEERADPAGRHRRCAKARRRCAWRASQATGARLLAEGSNGRVAARPGAPAAGARALSGRCRDQGAGLGRAHHPGEFPRAGRLLRLSGQAVAALPGHRGSPCADALRTGCRGRRCARCARNSARRRSPMPDVGPRPERARGAPTPEGLARTVAALMPEDAIIADESVSFGRGFLQRDLRGAEA